MRGLKSYTYLIIGDGEMQEGQVWEGAQFAAHQKLDHLIAFVDYNKKQLDGKVKDINDPLDIPRKFQSFGWHAQIVKGYDVEEIDRAIDLAKSEIGRPSVIVLDTIKGKGCNFAEEADFNHYMVIDQDMADSAIREIESKFN